MSEYDKWEDLSSPPGGKIELSSEHGVIMPFQLKMEHTIHLDFHEVEFEDVGDSGLDIIMIPTHGNVKTRLKINRGAMKAILEKILE